MSGWAHRSAVRALWLCLSLWVAAGAASANDRWRVDFTIDNDVVTGQDRHYTNGLFLSVLAPQDEVPIWIRKASIILNPFDPPPSQALEEGAVTDVRWGFALGHEMYTPENSALETVVVEDRPYAGYLYARFELARDRGRDEQAVPFLDVFQIDLGVVGPSALAKQGQRAIHEIFPSPVFEGWDNQLRDEPALTLRRAHYRRYPGPDFDASGDWSSDVIANIVGELGNVKTAATTGFVTRFGWRLPDDFGNGRFSPTDATADGFRLFFFFGVDLSFVARNIFLDGNTFRDSHHVDKKRFVVQAPFGAGYHYGRFKTQLSMIWNSKEFKGQDGADFYGGWSIVIDY